MKNDLASNEAPVAPAVAGQEIKPQAEVPAAAPVAAPEPAAATPPPASPQGVSQADPAVAAEPESDLDLSTLSAPGDASNDNPLTSPPAEGQVGPTSENLPGAPPEAGGPDATQVHRRPVVMPRRASSRGVYLSIVLFFLVAGAAACYGLYQQYEGNSSSLQAANDELLAQNLKLEQQADQQLEKNEGKAPGAVADDLKSAGISLLEGKVSMSVPAEWSKVPVAGCTGGSRMSEVVCQAVMAVAPNDQLQDDKTAKWKVAVGVYGYSAEDGNAQNWYETKYIQTSLASMVMPRATNISTEPVDGNSALQYQLVDGPAAKPSSVHAYYVVVHGQYAVVVSAVLQNSRPTNASGLPVADYRTNYGPAVQALFKSVKFKD